MKQVHFKARALSFCNLHAQKLKTNFEILSDIKTKCERMCIKECKMCPHIYIIKAVNHNAEENQSFDGVNY